MNATRTRQTRSTRPKEGARPSRTGVAPRVVPTAPLPHGGRDVITATVTGMGYDLVEVERGARGLLQVFIDRIPGRAYATGDGEFITVDDCEQVTRQLQYVLEVEGLDYARLEVSSPGLDRPLRTPADFARFAGQEIALTLKQPFEGRKSWRGVLQCDEAGYRLLFKDGPQEQVLGFLLEELREARLVPVVDFKGRGGKGKAAAQDAVAAPQDGGQV